MSLRNEIKAYLDGELDGNKSLLVADLLKSDEDLRKEADDFRAMSATLRLVAEPEVVSVGLGETLRALEGGSEAPRPVRRPWWSTGWGMSLTGACALLFLFVVLPFLSHPQAMDTASVQRAESKAVVPQAEAAKAMAKRSVADAAPMAADSAAGAATAVKSARPPEAFADSRRLAAPNPSAANRETYRPPIAPYAANRSVIQNANLTLYVKDVANAQLLVESAAKRFGGFVESSNLTQNGTERQAIVQIRVPVDRFQDALNAVRSLGDVVGQQIGGMDVTGQVADTSGRLKSLQAEADSLRNLMRQARNINEVLSVRDRLSQVEQEIAGLQSQVNALKDQSAMSTISVNLSRKPAEVTPAPAPQPVEPKTWLQTTIEDAVGTFMEIVQTIAGLFIHILALAPLWIPLALLSYWGWKVSEKKRGY